MIMKVFKFNKLSMVVMAIITLNFMSCSNEWLEDYTLDPARPSDVSMTVLLPSAQTSFAMVQGDGLARLSSVFMQQMTGTDRQALAHNRYAQIGEADFDGIWTDNGYSGGMYDLKLIIDKAGDASPHYAGVAKIMMAMYLGLFTDTWGDIPYSEALKGSDNLNPQYETQENIYKTIISLLDEGVKNVSEPSSAVAVGSEDIIYNGDMTNWAKLGHSLKARYLNHLSKKSSYDPAAILDAVSKGFESNADNASIRFLTPPNTNPWYQFNSQREGYISQFGIMYDMMESSNDPRIAFYRSEDSLNMPYYGSQTSLLDIMTYAELKFIEAEVKQKQGSGAETALNEAVAANMAILGVGGDDATAYIDALPASPTLKDVMNEKYVAMFSHIEAWTDWRRTGFPELSVYPGAQLDEIPRRLPYPQDERLYNANFINLSGAEAFTQRLWWDQ
jgi:hypothetical protein